MFEGRGTCNFLGESFSEKCGIIGIRFLKYVQNNTIGIIFEKYCKIIWREIEH